MDSEALFNLDAEAKVLGAMMMDASIIWEVSSVLKAEDFYQSQNQIIFSSLMTLSRNEKPTEINYLADFLKKKGLLDQVGGVKVLTLIQNSASIPSTVMPYVETIKHYSFRRTVTRIGNNLSARVKQLADDPRAMVLQAQEDLGNLLINCEESPVKYLSSIIEGHPEFFSERTRSERDGLDLGYPQLDQMIGGLESGKLFVIGGRPGMGKSALAENIALAVASRSHPVLYFSLEMDTKELMQRAIAQTALVDLEKVKQRAFTNAEKKKIESIKGKLASWPLAFSCQSDSAEEIISTIWREKMRNHIELVIIDYLHLIESASKESEAVRLSALMRKLKRLALKLNIPIIILSQLNRRIEERPIKERRPSLSDFRASGGIEEHADIVCGLFRIGYYTKDENDIHAELDILKNRSGKTGTVTLKYIAEFGRFFGQKEGKQS